MYIGDYLGRSATYYGTRTAIVDDDRGSAGRFSYQDLNERANRLANYLRTQGVEHGLRVGLVAHNGVEYLDAFFACGKLGAIFVPWNFRLHPRETAELAVDITPTVMIYGPEFPEHAAAVASVCPKTRLLHLSEKGALPGSESYAEALERASTQPVTCESLREEDIAALLFTGGTTGLPKGAMISHRMIAWNVLNTMIGEMNRDDATVTHTPMFHTGGLFVYTVPLLIGGGKVVIMRRWDPERMLALIGEERISIFFAVPTQYQQLLQSPRFAQTDFSGVRYMISGGAPLPVALIEAYQRTHRTPFKQGFGMTEFGPGMFSMGPEWALKKAGSIGRPNYFVDVRIVDDDGKPVPEGETGELLVKGPSMFSGYFGRKDATAEAIDAEGWLHTGDLCRRDADGFYFIMDRKKDMFISGGENVYPVEIERLLYQHPGVFQCAVIGVPDAHWGQVGRAFVVCKPGVKLEETELLEHLRTGLARYKVPKSVIFKDALPLSAAGKILKRELR